MCSGREREREPGTERYLYEGSRTGAVLYSTVCEHFVVGLQTHDPRSETFLCVSPFIQYIPFTFASLMCDDHQRRLGRLMSAHVNWSRQSYSRFLCAALLSFRSGDLALMEPLWLSFAASRPPISWSLDCSTSTSGFPLHALLSRGYLGGHEGMPDDHDS